MKQFTKILEDPKKLIALIIIIIVIIIILVYFGKKVKSLILENKARKTATKDLEAEIRSGGGLNYTESEYITFANKLYVAMKGLGTNTTLVYEVFQKLKSKADLLKLISVFGIKDNENLSQWLYGDLSNREIARVNSILANNGIDYSF